MAEKIEALSESNIAALATFREEWLRIGLDTTPLDKGKVRSAIDAAYRCAGLKPPEMYIWLDSPMGGAIGAAMLDQIGDQVGAQVRDQVWDQVGDQVRAQIGDQVRTQV